jgi:hypothetical protein
VRLGQQLSVPAATVRGWLRRLRSRAEDMRRDATVMFFRVAAGRDAPSFDPCGSALGDALTAVIACARAAVARHGYADADTDALLGRFGIAAPSRPQASPPRPGASMPGCARRHPA